MGASVVSGWPTVMPPDRVPAFEYTRLLPTSKKWFQPCTKMPPPPCELFVKLRPSTRDGLHWKLLGYLQSVVLAVSGTHMPFAVQFGSGAPAGVFGVFCTPLARTVMAAPS